MASVLLKRSSVLPASSTNSLLRRISTPLPLAITKGRPSFLRSNTIIPHQHHYSTSTLSTAGSKMASKQFLDIIKGRRTIYALKNESTISDKQIQEIIEQVVLHVPSSFNSQTTRIILLVKEEHVALWEIAKEVLKGIVTEEQWKSTEQRLNGFQAAYGTVLFFESRSGVTAMQEKFALYADRFPPWATQSDAMHQFAIWTALEAEGLGANLQHYNPLIDNKVSEKWNVPKDWELNAQLVFGTPAGEAGEKSFIPVEERFKTYGV